MSKTSHTHTNTQSLKSKTSKEVNRKEKEKETKGGQAGVLDENKKDLEVASSLSHMERQLPKFVFCHHVCARTGNCRDVYSEAERRC
jgi:hypothetical protein